MKTFFILAGALLAGSAFSAQDYVSREVMVKFKPGATFAKARAIDLIDGQVVKEYPFIGWTLVRYQTSYSVGSAVQFFRGFSDVTAAEPNYTKKLTFTPNDPLFSQQYGPKKIKADLAWNLTQGSSSVVVAVIDTGVQLNHPDLAGKLVSGFDYSDNDADPSDTNGHGTHCAGIVAAATNNGIGVAGTGFNTKVMPIKIFPNATISTVVNAVKHAADNGAKVLSMSYGGPFFSQAELDALNYAIGKGCLLVAGAGNEGNENLFYPAAYANVVSVAATDANDNMAGFSTHGDWVRVAAPGVGIRSTYLGGSYVNMDGTSMACPMVSGVAALCFARAPTATATTVRNAIYNTTDPVGSFVHFGRVNAFNAVNTLAPPIVANFVPFAMAMHTGSSSIGTQADVASSNNLYFRVNSTSTPLGQAAAATADILITNSMANNVGMKLRMEWSGSAGGTAFLYLKNVNTGVYEYYKAAPSKTVDGSITFDVAPGSKYVTSGGVLSLILRDLRSPRISTHVPFTLSIDEIRVTGTFTN